MRKCIALAFLFASAAYGQSTSNGTVTGASPDYSALPDGRPASLSLDHSGNLRVTGGGGGGAITATLGPTSASTGGITPQEVNAASSLVVKSSAGNWYSATVSAGTTAVYLMAFNATSAPADGAVVPVWCAGPFPASNATSVTWGPASPAYFSTGITLVTSSTGCTTKTATVVTTLTAQAQ